MRKRIWQNQVERDSRTPGPINLHLRWTERSKTTRFGQWQVSTLDFPTSTTDWEHPPGLVATGTVGRLTANGEIDITFTAPAADGGTHRLSRPIPDGGKRLARGVLAGLLSPNRFYVRIVGLDVERHPSGPPSNSIVVDWTPPASADFKFLSAEELRRRAEEAAKKAAANAPMRIGLRFQPFKLEASDARYSFIVNYDFALMGWHKGQHVTLKPSSDSDNVLDKIGEGISDVGDFFEDSANWVSTAWDDIKAFAVDLVADHLPFECNSLCRQALAKGLDAGLAAMGIPPSIPNFDELAKDGRGYLTRTLAEEAGVPPEAAEEVVDRMYEEVKKHAAGGSKNSLLRPDPSKLARPAMAWVDIVSQSPKELRDLDLVVDFYRVYNARRLPLPTIPPGSQLTVPVLLDSEAYQAWRWDLEAERRNSGSHAFVNESEVMSAWRKSHDNDRNTLSAVVTNAGEPSWQPIAMKNATFVAAAGYSG